jgi:hypothetical protein
VNVVIVVHQLLNQQVSNLLQNLRKQLYNHEKPPLSQRRPQYHQKTVKVAAVVVVNEVAVVVAVNEAAAKSMMKNLPDVTYIHFIQNPTITVS